MHDDLVVFAALGWERRAVTGASVAFASAGRSGWSARLPDGRACRVVQTGMGQDRARRAAEAAAPAARWVMAGCAGALVPELAAGDVVVASAVLTLDDGGAVVDRLPAESGPLVAWLTARGHAVREGVLASSPRVLATSAEKAAAASAGALAVDMESAAIAAVAQARRIPFVAVRVVLDVAGQALPLAELAGGDTAGIGMPRLLAALALRPGVWPSVARLAWQTRVVERRLRAVFADVLS